MDEKFQELKNISKKKDFYHSKNCFAKINDKSLLVESEDEDENERILEMQSAALNDFEDIDNTDILYFKLWNKFIFKYYNSKTLNFKIFEDSQKVKLLFEFISLNKGHLIDLENNFFMHLTSLLDAQWINCNDFLLIMNELSFNKKNN